MSVRKEFRVTYVSHSCLKIEGQHGTLLCDPWFLNEPVYDYALWKFPAAVIPPHNVIEGVDYIYITHSHEDHFHIPSLDYVPRHTTMILAEYTHHSSLRAQTIERVLRLMGFHRIVKLQPWETFSMRNSIPLISIPSAPTRSHDWENSGFVVEHPGCRLINMNDNISDEMLCTEIRRRFDSFDIGFIQAAGGSNFPACFKMPLDRAQSELQKKITNFSEQDRLIDMLKLRRAVAIAGDFAWYDDLYFDYNITARATPVFLQEHVRKTHPGCELIAMYPSDSWSMDTGRTQNHPEIDWANYIKAIQVLTKKFQKKIDHYRRWVDDTNRDDLLKRTADRVAIVNKHISQQYIDFTARFRVHVEGENSEFSFVMSARKGRGFNISLKDESPADQTLYVPERIWAAVLEGKIMWNMFCWAIKVEEHGPFQKDFARMWSWIEYNLDLNNKHTQAIIEPILFGWEKPVIRPQWGIVTFDDDWDLSWLT